jgi:hypothetical protein
MIGRSGTKQSESAIKTTNAKRALLILDLNLSQSVTIQRSQSNVHNPTLQSRDGLTIAIVSIQGWVPASDRLVVDRIAQRVA